MKWFYEWVIKKYNQSLDSQLESSSNIKLVASRRLDTYGLNFTVHKANGGFVIETSQYDKKTDRNDYNMHIITDDRDLGSELGKIVIMESLRR